MATRDVEILTNMSQAWLDIDIGDPEPYYEARDKYARAEAFMAAVGSQYGWDAPSVSELDEEQQSMLLEAYNSDPTWAAKGEASTSCPPPIQAGRIVVDLYETECPKTVANFKALCTGEKELGKSSKKPLHYKGHRFHRIVSGFCCQGGDVVRGDGSGGESIYGGSFNDEKKGFTLKHDAAGVLSMANSGKNTNTSQFFFTLAPAPPCDDKEASSADGTPRVQVTIRDCGLGA